MEKTTHDEKMEGLGGQGIQNTQEGSQVVNDVEMGMDTVSYSEARTIDENTSAKMEQDFTEKYGKPLEYESPSAETSDKTKAWIVKESKGNYTSHILSKNEPRGYQGPSTSSYNKATISLEVITQKINIEHTKLIEIANKIMSKMEDPLDVWAGETPEIDDISEEYNLNLEDSGVVLDIINYRP